MGAHSRIIVGGEIYSCLKHTTILAFYVFVKYSRFWRARVQSYITFWWVYESKQFFLIVYAFALDPAILRKRRLQLPDINTEKSVDDMFR